jgi:hypothetical protein
LVYWTNRHNLVVAISRALKIEKFVYFLYSDYYSFFI